MGLVHYFLNFFQDTSIIAYFAMRIVSELATKLLNERHPETQASSARSIIRIGGFLIILAIVVIMLARDPYVTLAVTTITGIALAISIQRECYWQRHCRNGACNCKTLQNRRYNNHIWYYRLCQGYWTTAIRVVEHNSG